MTTAQLRRFVDKVRFELLDEDLGECWIWTATRLKAGYGKVGIDSVVSLAHRVSYAHFVGTIPDGMDIDHLCRRKGCVNPRHLEAVTRSVNLQRGMSPIHMARVGRAMKGKPNPHSAEHRASLCAAWSRRKARAA